MSNILIGITGSIAAYKIAEVVSTLTQAGHTCRIMMTASATKFIGPATFEGLSNEPVLTDTFTNGEMMSHIHWARWADLFLIAPATANQINKMAAGIGDDLVSTTFLAFENTKPIMIAPAMNTMMYRHFTVQKSLATLKEAGVMQLSAEAGPLACGEYGEGRMMEPQDIVKNIRRAIKAKAKTKAKKILITFGGTKEMIDGVRFIQNMSTGQTGLKLATGLSEIGHEVSVLAAHSTRTETIARSHLWQSFDFFDGHSDLEKKILAKVSESKFDWIVHLAAVSDYSVDRISSLDGEFAPSSSLKLPSNQPFSLHLKINEKIVNKIKGSSLNKGVKVIAFKLTNSVDESMKENAIKKLLHSDGVDFVVHNDLHEIDKASASHLFHLYDQNGQKENLPDTDALTTRLNSLTHGEPNDTLS